MDERITLNEIPGSDLNAQQAANELREAAGDKTKQLKESAVEKAQQFRKFAGAKASDISETAKFKAQNIKELASEQVKSSQVKAREMHSEAEDYIRTNPTKSVLTALGVGVVIGLVIRR